VIARAANHPAPSYASLLLGAGHGGGRVFRAGQGGSEAGQKARDGMGFVEAAIAIFFGGVRSARAAGSVLMRGRRSQL